MASGAPKLMPLARLGRGAFSGSITRANVVTGTHLHRILGYSHVDRATTTGDLVKSEPFVVGDREWTLKIYPSGFDDAKHRGFVSADLSLSGYGTPTMATYRVSILDHEGNPAHSRVGGPHRFIPSELSRMVYSRDDSEPTGIRELVGTDELKRSAPFLLWNDCLDVRCDVAMVKMETKPKKWFMGFGSNDLV